VVVVMAAAWVARLGHGAASAAAAAVAVVFLFLLLVGIVLVFLLNPVSRLFAPLPAWKKE
jgi:hypothetical protein